MGETTGKNGWKVYLTRNAYSHLLPTFVGAGLVMIGDHVQAPPPLSYSSSLSYRLSYNHVHPECPFNINLLIQ